MILHECLLRSMKSSASCFALLFGRQHHRLLLTGSFRHSISSRLMRPHASSTRVVLFSTSASSSSSQATADNHFITFLTDLEGDANYLDRFVNQSKVLKFRKISPRYQQPQHDDCFFPYDHCMDFTTDNSILVYGGDTCDRGGFDLYCLRQLLDFKRRYPERVHFVMGNRDINKMRVLDELDVATHGGVYWLRGTDRIGDPIRMPGPEVPNNAAERLKWILSGTMGSPKAFELRRHELMIERKQEQQRQEPQTSQDNLMVSDEDVVESYRRSCHPVNGEMGQYLSQAQLAVKLGNVLFVHGALPLTHEVLQLARPSTGFWRRQLELCMPWRISEEESAPSATINDWIEALNQFAHDQVVRWKDNIQQQESGQSAAATSHVWATRGGYHHYESGTTHGDLMQYGMGWMPTGDRNPTVVYSSWMTSGLPRRFFPTVAQEEDGKYAQLAREFFDEAGIELIVCGHQPHGDMPTVINLGDNKHVICCDTNYAGDTIWLNSEDTEMKERTNIKRGVGGRGEHTVNEVLIEQCEQTGSVLGVRCHGVLSNTYRYDGFRNDVECWQSEPASGWTACSS